MQHIQSLDFDINKVELLKGEKRTPKVSGLIFEVHKN